MNITQSNSPGFTAILLRVIGLSLALSFAGLAWADPPERVARMGFVTGSVSFSPAGENDWVAGTLNRPLVTGDRLWADGGARVELQIGTAVVRLGSRTYFTLTNLDDRIAQMNLQDGTINLRVRRLDRGQVVEVDTPNLAFVIRQPGEYRITVDNQQDSTEVRTRSGRADVYGAGATYAVATGAAYRFFGGGLADYDVIAMPRADEFDRWSQARDRQYDTSVSARYVSRDVIGYQDLDQYGSWRNVAGYGNVWSPTRVAADWAPYRDGHWSWIEPWGWTWVDDQPWGFAVSHYGRWANTGGRWGWIPGPVSSRAVYAPALVAFVGGSNFQVTASSGNVGAVGWFPLGPREVYHPAYAVSRTYFTNVNISNTVINNTVIINNYDNRIAGNVANNGNGNSITYANRRVPGAVVTVPTTAFVQSQPVARAALRVNEASIVAASVTTMAALAPVQTSVLGGAAPTRVRPPQVAEQRFVAQSKPPAAAVGFAVKERALAASPGKPVDSAALATLKPVMPAPGSTPGAPGAAVPPPKVELVPTAPGAGPAVAAPPPKAPSDRRGKSEQPLPPRAGQPTALPPQAQPAPASLPPAPAPVTKPAPTPAPMPVPVTTKPGLPAVPPPAPAPAPQNPKPGSAPSEAPVRPDAKPPVQAGPAAPTVAPTAPAPTGPGNKPREQRDMPVTVPPANAPMPVAPPAPIKVQPPVRTPVQTAPPVTVPGVAVPVERPPVQRPRVRPEPPESAKPKPAPVTPPVPAPAVQPKEPANPPPTSGKGNQKAPVVEDKKDDKAENADGEKKRK